MKNITIKFKVFLKIMLVILCVSILFSCKKESDRDEVGFSYCFRDIYEISENVYTAYLLKYEETGFFDELGEKQIKVTLEIDSVFKGNYLSGEIIDYLLPVSSSMLNENVGAVKNGKYLFMTGVDLDYNGDIDSDYIDNSLKIDNLYDIIRIEDDGSLKQKADHFKWWSSVFSRSNELPPSCFYEIINRILDYKGLKDYYKKEHEMSMLQAYDEADNVYLGEILEYEQCSDNKYSYEIYKVQIKIKTVYKGEYAVGNIVNDFTVSYYNGIGLGETMLFINGEKNKIVAFNEAETTGAVLY